METKIAQTPEELQQVMAIREKVVREQQVPPELEKDADDSAIHFLALVNGQEGGTPCGPWR